MKPTIPILTLRLLDIKIPRTPDIKKLFLVGARDLLLEHPDRVAEKAVDVDIFHNSENQYSAIQLSRYKGSPEWTAIGARAVTALQLWYELFEKNTPELLQNAVEIRERYTPAFLNFQKEYQVRPLLVSDATAKELNEMKDKFGRRDRLEKYLYGNLRRFFKHIDFDCDAEQHFLKVSVAEIIPFNKALTVYHNNKKTAFEIAFRVNFLLPQTIRLGQSTALGFGGVRHR